MEMAYRSLYDFIELKKEFQIYKGNLNLILTDIIRILGKKKKTKRDYSILAFQSPRIIRVLIDYKNNHPKDKKLPELLRNGMYIALKVYQEYDNPKIREEILKFKKEIINRRYNDILQKELRQYYDQINLIVSKSEFSQKAAEKLMEIVGTNKAMLILLGHGAINSGMDVFLRYKDKKKRSDVLFYVVRFSRTKYKKYQDKVPQLTPEEIKYLQTTAQGRKIIIYDENTFTGTTLRIVTKYFSKNIFPNHKIHVLYNLDTSES